MRITRAAEYGIRALMYLALQPRDKVCLISEISVFQDVPEKYLAKILQSLAKRGLVKSYRGVKGGFSLALSPEEINLKDVIECLEGPMALNKCLASDDPCKRAEGCRARLVWAEAQEKLLSVLSGVSLKNLVHDPPSPGK